MRGLIGSLLFTGVFHSVDVPDKFNGIGFGLFKGLDELFHGALFPLLFFHFVHREGNEKEDSQAVLAFGIFPVVF
jgi:hypothetical protein